MKFSAKLLNTGTTWRQVTSVAVALVMSAVALLPATANAAQITARSVTLSSSSPAAATATTTYSLTFTIPSTTTVQSFQAQACTTAIGTCTTPTGFSSSASTFSGAAVLSNGTWSVNTATSGALRATATGSTTTTATSKTISFGSVQNPTTANTSFYLRLTTYSDTAWATPIDTGTVGTSTTVAFVVNADVAESITFCVGVTASTSCVASGTSLTVAPNPLTTASISTGTSQMTAYTNAQSGYTITYLAGNFTSAVGGHTITAFPTTATASAIGTEQFGLRAAISSGSGSSVSAAYNTTDYAFNPGSATTIATAAGPVSANQYTVTYGANVAPTTESGAYSSTFNYVITGNF